MASNRPSYPWRKWYSTVRWERLRQATFLRDLYTCTKCGCIEGNTSKLVCDHIVPHRGDEHKFFDQANLATLCKPCHDTIKQAEEQGSLHTRGVWH